MSVLQEFVAKDVNYFDYKLSAKLLNDLIDINKTHIDFLTPSFKIVYKSRVEKWCLEIMKNANGNVSVESGFIALHLVWLRDTKEIRTRNVEISVEDTIALRCNGFDLAVNGGCQRRSATVFDMSNFSWGWKKFLSIEELRKVVNQSSSNVITLHCKLVVNNNNNNYNTSKKHNTPASQSPPSSSAVVDNKPLILHTLFLSCIGQSDEDTFSDVEFVSRDHKTFNAHRNIISRNEALRTNLLSNIGKLPAADVVGGEEEATVVVRCASNKRKKVMVSSTQTQQQQQPIKDKITLIDVNSEALVEFFRFVYLNTVENLHTVAEDLLYVAEKYLEMELKRLCIDYLIHLVSPSNACHLLILAEKFNDHRFKQHCLMTICCNKQAIVGTDDWRDVVEDLALLNQVFLAEFVNKKTFNAVEWSPAAATE